MKDILTTIKNMLIKKYGLRRLVLRSYLMQNK